MKARGISTATYRVLHLLPYRGGYLPWRGVPRLAWGYLPWPGTLGWGYIPWQGVPTLARGDLPWPGGHRPWGNPLPSGPGWGTPPQVVDRKIPVETVPYRRTTYVVGNKLLLYLVTEIFGDNLEAVTDDHTINQFKGSVRSNGQGIVQIEKGHLRTQIIAGVHLSNL